MTLQFDDVTVKTIYRVQACHLPIKSLTKMNKLNNLWKLLAQRTSWDSSFFFQALSHNIAWKVSKINVFLRLKSWSWTSWLNPSPTNFWFFVRQCNFFLVFFLVLEKLGKLTLWNLCPFLLVQLYTLFTHYSAEILLVLSTFHFSWPVL